MPDRDGYEPGTPCWVDLGVPDLGAAATFYSALFGWECPEGDPAFGGYRVCTLRGRTVAGLGPQQGPGATWTTYVWTDDAAATLAAVEGAGGAALAGPMAVGDLGTMALASDPEGVTFGLWQGAAHRGAGVVDEPGALTWNELVTHRRDAAEAFYRRVFGWGVHASEAYTEWKVGERSVGGCLPAPHPDVPASWSTYFAVADCDLAAAEVRRLGGSVVAEPFEIPDVGRTAVVAGVAGEVFQVLALAREPD